MTKVWVSGNDLDMCFDGGLGCQHILSLRREKRIQRIEPGRGQAQGRVPIGTGCQTRASTTATAEPRRDVKRLLVMKRATYECEGTCTSM